MDKKTKLANQLIDKPNKSEAEWHILWLEGLADYDPADDSYKLNEFGMAGGIKTWLDQKRRLNRDGQGPL